MFYWKAYSDDGAFEDNSERGFEDQIDAYYDMREAVLKKMCWNTCYDEDFYDCPEIEYQVVFRQDKITHLSYSGLYTYEIYEQ